MAYEIRSGNTVTGKKGADSDSDDRGYIGKIDDRGFGEVAQIGKCRRITLHNLDIDARPDEVV